MKKILLVTIALTAFVLFSCNQAASSDDTKKTSGSTEKPAGSSTNEVDLRNKDKSGTSVKRSAAADVDDDAPIGVYVKKDPTCKFGPLTDEDLENAKRKYEFRSPFTKESLLYRDLFEKYYPGQARMVVDFWMPNKNWEGCDVNDPSARVLSNYGESGK